MVEPVDKYRGFDQRIYNISRINIHHITFHLQPASQQLTAENRRLRQLEIRQTKALQSYERSEYSLPGILHHHQKQTEGLKEQIKK